MKSLDGSRGPHASAAREIGLGSVGGGMQGANDRLRALQNGAYDSDDSDAREEYFVPDSLARACAKDVLEVMRALARDQRVVGMCAIYQAIAGRNFARSKGKLSPTCIERIIELLRKMGLSDRVIRRILTALNRIFRRAINAGFFMGLTQLGGPQETNVFQAIMVTLLVFRRHFYAGADLRDMDLTVEALSLDLHCAFTAYMCRRILNGVHGYVYDRAAHQKDFVRAHGELLACRKAVVAPMLANPLVLMDCVITTLARLTDVDGRLRPVLLATAVRGSGEIMARDHGAIGFAALDVLKAVAALEQVHLAVDHRVDLARYESEDHFFLVYGQRPLSGRRDITRCGASTLRMTLGFVPGKPSVTYGGCLVGEMYTAPDHPAFARLFEARTGTYMLLDMLEREVREDYFELYNDPSTIHTGSSKPAELLAEEEDKWVVVV